MRDARTACHEAGHAVIALALGLPISTTTIAPDDSQGFLGRIVLDVEQARAAVPVDAGPADLVQVDVMRVAFLLGGEIAERIGFGAAQGGGCRGDREASEAAVERMDDTTGAAAWRWRPAVEREVESYLRRHWSLVTALAAALLAASTLTGERVREVVGELPNLDLSNAVGGARFWSHSKANA